MHLQNLIICNDGWNRTDKLLVIEAGPLVSTLLDVAAAERLYGDRVVVSFKENLVVVM